jgi:hypothetical protein
VGEGNVAVLLCPFQNAHLDELGLRVESGPGEEAGASAESGAPLTGEAPSLLLKSGATFKIEEAKFPVQVLYTTRGLPAVLLATLGAGRMILLAESFPATNVGLPGNDNALFLLTVAETVRGGGGVLFDETSTRLEMGAPGVMAYARKAGVQPIFVELGILALLAIWHFGARTAPPISRRPRPRAAVPDYVTGRARLYEKASMGRTAVRALAETLRDALRRAKPDSDADAAEGQKLLERAGRLERLRSPRDHDLIDFARSIHDFMNEAIWKPGRRFRRAPHTAPWRPK